jgi:hypothetical protein
MEDVPEADALEQSQPVDPRLDEPEIEKSERRHLRDDVPEADALEQAEPVMRLDPERE